jgi:hypothetical protein
VAPRGRCPVAVARRRRRRHLLSINLLVNT